MKNWSGPWRSWLGKTWPRRSRRPFLGFLPCPHYKPKMQEDNALNGDNDFYRPIIPVEMD